MAEDYLKVKDVPAMWREHWENRNAGVTPVPRHVIKQIANRLGQSLFWTMQMSSLYIGFWIMLPHYSKQSELPWTQAGMAATMLLLSSQIIGNWFVTRYTGSWSALFKQIPNIDGDAGWRSCEVCRLDIPPRSQHCQACRVCILKRDHHCHFVGRCIGFYNQRHFLVFCFYVAFGCSYICCLDLGYLYQTSGFSWSGYLLPVTLWAWSMRGTCTLRNCLLLFHAYSTACMAMAGLRYFLWQTLLLLNDQTSYEAKMGLREYDGGTVRHRIRNVMGAYFPIQLLLPLPTALPGDGVRWRRYKTKTQ